MTRIAIIDYQMGNLRSVAKAVELIGAEAIITSDQSEIRAADKVILPGVGAFKDAMAELKRRDLPSVIRDVIQEGKPFFGICLGLQMLFDSSDEGCEFGSNRTEPYEGLGILPGRCVRFQRPHEFKVPHMGWNTVINHNTSGPLWSSLEPSPYFYFVHSYYVVPKIDSDIWLTTDYGGEFCAAVSRGNLFATQFHPEKSQKDGLQLLKNFAELDLRVES